MDISDSVSAKDIFKGGKTIKLIYKTIFSEPLSFFYYGFFFFFQSISLFGNNVLEDTFPPNSKWGLIF